MSRFHELIQTDAFKVPAETAKTVLIELDAVQAAAADDDAVMASQEVGSTAGVVVTEFDGQPPYARNITIKSTGTDGNVKAGTAVIEGIDIDGNAVSESVTITADTHVNFVGTKAMKEVKKITIPAMDGTVTFKAGFGDLYGLPFKFAKKPLAIGSVAEVQEDVTIAKSASELAGNTFTFSSAPAGEAVQVALIL